MVGVPLAFDTLALALGFASLLRKAPRSHQLLSALGPPMVLICEHRIKDKGETAKVKTKR